MKKILLAIMCIAASLFNRTSAQTNKPTGVTSPSGTAPTVSLPAAYDALGTPSFYNYTQTWMPLKPITDTSKLKFKLTSSNTIPVVTSYTNGFGQLLMSIVHGNYSTKWKDVIQAADVTPSLTHNYFMPYAIPQNSDFQMNPLNDELTYYNSMYPNEGTTAYSQNTMPDDQSTITSKDYAPGLSFVGQGRGSARTLTFNDGSENIVKYFVNVNDALDGFRTYYNTSDLTVETEIGQHGKKIKVYKNKFGQLVCKKQYAGVDKHGINIWQTTYYAYDLMGNLRYVLPPLVSAANPSAANISTYSSLYYAYKYDNYGNLTESDIPGKNGATYNVYDNKFRPVLIQTPLLRAQGKWQFAIYDSKDRVVVTGLLTDANNFSTWQGWANGSVTPSGGVVTGSLLYYILNGFTGTYPSTISNCEIRTLNYYDNYTWDPVFSSNTFGTVNTTDFKTDATAILPVPYMFTHGMLTARKTKVVAASGSFPNQWVTDVYFYDQKGELIQVQTLNPWNTSQWDTATYQYDFAGHNVFEMTHHFSWNSCDKPDTRVENAYYYDDYGRLSSIQQRADGANWRVIATSSYDELGRMNNLTLGGVEKQDLSYNIRGQLESINPDYVVTPTIPDKTFGAFLSYDYGFDSVRFDGSISGIQWRGAGLASPLRAYGYKYDQAGRLNFADFNENSSGSPGAWFKSTNDFSMSNVTYDVNGNILTMNQRGSSGSGPVDIDNLSYTYNANSNQLQRVKDAITTNYGIGDFQDITATTDYTYDDDGNLASDYNKSITSITYNELDQPTRIQFAFGSITSIYTATGSLIQKTIVDSSVSPAHTDVYKYWMGFTYRNDSLLYMDHSAGRARWQSDSGIFKYDYYVTDHQGNVRSVVTTDEGSPINYFASHELASAALESSIFANLDSVRDLKPGSTNPYDIEAAHLDGSDAQKRIGTAILMSVMAGDKFDISATSYYDTNSAGMTTYADGYSMLNAITSSLVNGAGGYAGEGNNTNMVNSLFTSSNYLSIYEPVLDNLADPTRPRAFINYLVFDQSMNLVPEQSGAIQVGSTPGTWQSMGTTNPVSIGQNGYVAIYMSDEQFMPVYMDQMHITYYRGRLIQEQHYYPFGLPINPVTSSGTLPIKNQFEGNQTNKELGLNQADFNFRQYDYQIGKFTSIDPLADAYGQESLSPYHFAENNPANFTDPIGLNSKENRSGGSGGTVVMTPKGRDDHGPLGPGFYYDFDFISGQDNYQHQSSAASSGGNNGAAADPSVIEALDGGSAGSASPGSGGAGGGPGGPGGNGGDNTKEGHIIYGPEMLYWNGGNNGNSRARYSYSIAGKYYDLYAIRDFYNRNKSKPAYKYKNEIGEIIPLNDAYGFEFDGKPWKPHAEVITNMILTPNNIVTVGNATPYTDNNLTTVSPGMASEAGHYGRIHLHPVDGGSITWMWRSIKGLMHIDGIFPRSGPSPTDRLGLGHNSWDVLVTPTTIYIYNEFESEDHIFYQ